MQENNTNSPNPNPNPFLQRLNEWLYKITDAVLTLMHKALIQLHRLWEWYQSIDFPEIPLTPLQWILLSFTIFALLFTWATPVFEASDEVWHFGVIEHIRENGSLPIQDPENIDTIYREMGSQPPLYYGLATVITLPLDLSNADAFREPNPYANIGRPNAYGNKNIVLHSTEQPDFTGTVAAVYLLRIVGIATSLVTIWAVYQCGIILVPHRPVAGIVAAALTALNPMFMFTSAAVSNEALVIMLNSLAIWLALLTMRDGFDLRRSVAIGVLIGLAALTKLSGLTLIPVLLIGALWIAQRDKDWQGFVTLLITTIVGFVLIAGWWYYRNVDLYGEFFGINTMLAVLENGRRTDTFTLGSFLSEFQGFRLSYWGIFGASNIQTTALYYAIVDFAIFIALFGAGFVVAQLLAIKDFSFARRELTQVLFLLGIVLIGGVALIYWTTQTLASQGHLMFPYIAAISPLLAMGFVEIVWWMLFLLSPPDRSFVRAGDAVPNDILVIAMRWPLRFLGFFALLIPIFTVAPQYRAPRPLDALPGSADIVYANYGNYELIGYDHVDRRYIPGERVRVTFYWRVLEQSETDDTLSLTLMSPYGDNLGVIDTYPGAGTLRTSAWEEGKIYADTYAISLLRTVNVRYPFDVRVAWYQEHPDDAYTITNRDEETLDTVRLGVGAIVTPNFNIGFGNFASLTDIERPNREFGNQIRLEGVNVELPHTVELLWGVTNPINDDYTTFAHILNSEGELVGQALPDVFPELPTHYWRISENYITRHMLEFFDTPEPGIYTVGVGWYLNDGDTLPRLLINEGIEDEEQSAYTVYEFEITNSGILRLPAFDVEEDDETELTIEVELTGQVEFTPDAETTELATEPAATPTGAVNTSEPEATEIVTEEATEETED